MSEKNYRGRYGKSVWENRNFAKGIHGTDEPLREGTLKSLANFDISKTGGTLEVRDPLFSVAFKLGDSEVPHPLNKDTFLFKSSQDTSKEFFINIGAKCNTSPPVNLGQPSSFRIAFTGVVTIWAPPKYDDMPPTEPFATQEDCENANIVDTGYYDEDALTQYTRWMIADPSYCQVVTYKDVIVDAELVYREETDPSLIGYEFTPYERQDEELTILDGDTIEYNGIRYRLLGIDAPEIRNQYGAFQEDGANASRELYELINGKYIKVVYDQHADSDVDIYGRHLVWLWYSDDGQNWDCANMDLLENEHVKLMGAFNDSDIIHLPSYKGGLDNFTIDFKTDVESYISSSTYINNDKDIVWYEEPPQGINVYSKQATNTLGGHQENSDKVKIPYFELIDEASKVNMSQLVQDLELPVQMPLRLEIKTLTYENGTNHAKYYPITRLDDIDGIVFLGKVFSDQDLLYEGIISVKYLIPLEGNTPDYDNAEFVVETYRNNAFKIKFEELNNRFDLNLLDPVMPGRRDYVMKEVQENNYYSHYVINTAVLNENNEFVSILARGGRYLFKPYFVLPEIQDQDDTGPLQDEDIFDGYAIKWIVFNNENSYEAYEQYIKNLTDPDFEGELEVPDTADMDISKWELAFDRKGRRIYDIYSKDENNVIDDVEGLQSNLAGYLCNKDWTQLWSDDEMFSKVRSRIDQGIYIVVAIAPAKLRMTQEPGQPYTAKGINCNIWDIQEQKLVNYPVWSRPDGWHEIIYKWCEFTAKVLWDLEVAYNEEHKYDEEIVNVALFNLAHANSFVRLYRNQEVLESDYQHGQNLHKCRGITFYEGHLILYDSPDAPDVIYMSDEGGNITYFPFKRALDQFTGNVVHVQPTKQGLIVFTTTDVYLVHRVIDMENNVFFRADVVYSNLTIKPHNRNTVRSVGKDIMFIADNSVLMLRPNPYVNDVTDMFMQDISQSIKRLLEKPVEYLKERAPYYGIPYDLDLSGVKQELYTVVKNEEVWLHISYDIPDYDPFMVIAIYSREQRRWRLYDTMSCSFPYQSALFDPVQGYHVLMRNHKNYEDGVTVVINEGIVVLDFQDDAEITGTVFDVQPFHIDGGQFVFNNTTIPDIKDYKYDDDYHKIKHPIRCYIDTGYMAISPQLYKRYNRFRLDLHNFDCIRTPLFMEFNVDGVPRQTSTAIHVIQDQSHVWTTERLFEPVEKIPDHHLLGMWQLDHSMFGPVKKLKIDLGISGRGRLPQMQLGFLATGKFRIYGYTIIYKEQTAR